MMITIQNNPQQQYLSNSPYKMSKGSRIINAVLGARQVQFSECEARALTYSKSIEDYAQMMITDQTMLH